ncbi:hypothetical protein EZS27_044400, partial [termite gut metagenome]
WKTENERTGIINSFLYNQKHISTEGYGVLTPLNIDEYCTHSGVDDLKKPSLRAKSINVSPTIASSSLLFMDNFMRPYISYFNCFVRL